MTDTSVEEYLRLQAQQMSEKEFQNKVISLGKTLGWTTYHTWNSKYSESGYPDLNMLNPIQKRILWAELKREGEKLTLSQLDFQELIEVCEGEYHIWYPSMWFSGEIERILVGKG